MRRSGAGRRKQQAGVGSLMTVLLLALVVFLANRVELAGPFRAPAADPKPGPAQAVTADGELHAYFLDVGQGDSQLIRIPEGDGYFNILLDTGEYQYAGGLTDYLRDLGVERIDGLICSHPHTDHMGCMARIVQRFEIGRIYMPRVPEEIAPATAAYEALLDAADRKGMTIAALDQDTEIEVPPGAAFEVLAPRADAQWDDLNNCSAVFRLSWGKTSFLFTGDAEEASEKLILEDAENWGLQLRSDVLKCGHHGSKTSSSANFLKAVLPEFAVISCGEGNDYGHPHRGTLEKLGKIGAKIYRTDQQGTILAKSDGRKIAWETGFASVESWEKD